MSEQVKNEVNNTSTLDQPSTLSETVSNLTHALHQNTNTVSDYTQQTLIDVNSQPLMHNLMDNHSVLTHPSLTAGGQLLSGNSPMLSSPVLVSQDTTNSTAQPMPTSTLDPNSPLIREFYEKFATGRMFQTLEELRTEAYEYGRKHNVALTTSKSDKTKVYLICKHGGQYRKNNKRPPGCKSIKPRIRRSQKTGCACMIYARCCRGSFWIIRKSIGEHNHPIADDPSAYAMYRSLSPEDLITVHRLLREHVGVSFIVKSLRAQGVTNILPKDIENIQQDLKRRDVLDLPPHNNTNIIATSSDPLPTTLSTADASIVATMSTPTPTVMLPTTTISPSSTANSANTPSTNTASTTATDATTTLSSAIDPINTNITTENNTPAPTTNIE